MILWLCMGCTFSILADSQAAMPIDITNRLELMLDDYLIDSMNNLQFRLHHPHRAEKVLLADKPWEGNSLNHITVFKDGDLYRMYYSGYVSLPGTSWQNDHHTCYAESRDGMRINRKYMEAFIRPGLDPDKWASHANFMAMAIVPTSDSEISLYLPEFVGDNINRSCPWIRRWTLRTDGFVSIQAPYNGGEFTTKPLIFEGNRLVINASTSAAGSIFVELQDENGNPIPGFTQNESMEFFGDAIAHTVQWKDNPDLGKLAGQKVRLRFTMKDADLYSFQFLP